MYLNFDYNLEDQCFKLFKTFFLRCCIYIHLKKNSYFIITINARPAKRPAETNPIKFP